MLFNVHIFMSRPVIRITSLDKKALFSHPNLQAKKEKMISEFWLNRVLEGCCGNPKIAKTKSNI